MNFPSGKKIFSLKWKTLLVLGVVALSVHLLLLALGYRQLDDQFRAQQMRQVAGQGRILTELMQRDALRLQYQAVTLASLAGMTASPQIPPANVMRSNLEPHWFDISVEQGLESLFFFDGSGQEVIRWQDGNELVTSMVRAGVRKSLQRAEPQHGIVCDVYCRQVVFVPLLTRGGSPFVAVLGASLADLVTDFKRISNADVALLVPRTGSETNTDTCCWGRRVAAMSDAQNTVPLLTRLVLDIPDLETARSGKLYPIGDRHFLINYQPQVIGAAPNTAVVFAEELTSQVQEIGSDVRRLTVLSLLAFLVTMLILALVLWRPMSQLRKLATGLPLIAERRYDELRRIIGRRYETGGIKDETDLLDAVSVELSHHLERMEDELRGQAKTLAKQSRELADERDFNQKILDTAQAIVLLHDGQGRLLEINDYGEQASGYTQQSLRGKPLQHFVTDDCKSAVTLDVQEILHGERSRIQREAGLRCADGSRKEIVWLHARLQSRFAALLSVGVDVTDRKQAELRLRWLADHDVLTGLFNRNRFSALVTSTLDELPTTRARGALMYIDIDEFRGVAESAGPAATDDLLRNITGWLVQLLGDEVPLARIGGSEFAAMIEESDETRLIELGRSLAKSIGQAGQLAPSGGGPGTLHVTASIGIARFPEHATTQRELFACADSAVYMVKKEGGNNVKLYGGAPSRGEQAAKRAFWRDRIRHALEEDRFVLHYQPIVKTMDRSVTHCEALVRMLGEDGQIIGPGEFVPIAETHGLIVPIEHWVIRHAIGKVAALQRSGKRYGMSINLSGHSFQDPDLVQLIRQAIADTGANPAGLIFEITETAAVSNLTLARKTIEEVRALGCRFAFDDFGVGFTSFQYLKRLPVDYVKLDRSYVANVDTDRGDQVLVRSMNELVTGLGKQVIAEGVETRAAYEWLKAVGVEHIQGYLFGKPAPDVPEAAQLFPVEK